MAQVMPARPMRVVAALTERTVTVQNMDRAKRTSEPNHARFNVKPGILSRSSSDGFSS